MPVKAFLGFEIKYFDIAYDTISYIYVVTAILLMRADLIKQQIELTKIAEVQKEVKKEMQERKKEKKKKEEDNNDVEVGVPDDSEKKEKKKDKPKDPNPEPNEA